MALFINRWLDLGAVGVARLMGNLQADVLGAKTDLDCVRRLPSPLLARTRIPLAGPLCPARLALYAAADLFMVRHDIDQHAIETH